MLQQALVPTGAEVHWKKTHFTASSPAMAKAITAELNARGITIGYVKVAKDLGISTASGARRVAQASSKRMGKSHKRAGRVRVVVKKMRWKVRSVKKARGLYSSGVAPQGMYGGEAMGFSPTTLKRLRATATRSQGLPAGACATAALDILTGATKDPSIAGRVSVLKAWLALWADDAVLHRRLAKTWHKRRKELANPTTRWVRVRGAVGAAVGTLLDIGWQPLEPACWRDDLGDEWRFQRGFSFAPLPRALEVRISRRLRECIHPLARQGHARWRGLTCG